MADTMDPELVLSFVNEARGYLPHIMNGLDGFWRNPAASGEVLEEAYRFVHTIKGASSMVGLIKLSRVANQFEEIFNELRLGSRVLDDPGMAAAIQICELMDEYLDSVTSGTAAHDAFVRQTIPILMRWKGLPESRDEEAIRTIVTEGADEEPETRTPAAVAPLRAAPAPPAAPKPAPKPAGPSPEILEAFLLEAEEHLQTIGRVTQALEKTPQDRKLIQEMRRSVHTMKGTAGMVGLPKVAQVSHRAEDLLDALFEGSIVPGREVIDYLFAVSELLDQLVRSGETETTTKKAAELEEWCSRLMAAAPAEDVRPALSPETPTPSFGDTLADEEILASGQAPRGAELGAVSAGPVLRVPLERLDEMVKLIGELVISRSSVEQYLGRLRQETEELQTATDRLRRLAARFETGVQVRTAAAAPVIAGGRGSSGYGFDALEFDRYSDLHLLSRELAEASSDVSSISSGMRELSGDFEAGINRLGRLTTESHDHLMRLRMVPVATLASKLHRTVRVTASQQGKVVDFEIHGEDVELDKNVLDQMADPLLHLLRNAVGHGIEPSALRAALGKPGTGRISLRAFPEGTRVALRVTDDGAGLDPERIRRVAVEKGLASEAAAAHLSREDLLAFVFVPGFSTAEGVDEIAGRGVGMDVVKSTVERLKGSVEISFEPGSGMTTTIRLPMSLAVMRVLLVRSASETFAIPLSSVSRIFRLEKKEIEALGKDPLVRREGKVYPVLWLASLLGLENTAIDALQRVPALILDLGGREVALLVEELAGGREAVVKPLGAHMKNLKRYLGATILGDGSVVLILNPLEISRPAEARLSGEETVPSEAEALDVLIVDDSFSVRRVISNLIRSAGWEPSTARDGVDALEILQKTPRKPAVILLDVEMPRMDGYELLATLRGQDEFRSLPVVMLTSRAGEKHRKKALDLGASAYVVKPYRDEELLGLIRKLSSHKA